VFTIGRIVFRPKRMVWGEDSLVEFDYGYEKFLYYIHEKVEPRLRFDIKSLHFYYNIFLEKIQ
jgi:hypothetical protein